MMISEIRLSPLDEANLRWWLCESEGDMGARSALGGQIDRLSEGRVGSGQVVDAHEIAIHQIANVDRARRTARIFESIKGRHQHTLRAALGPGLPAASVADLSELATPTVSLALLLLTAYRTHVGRARLRAWLRPPTAKPLPDDATPAQKVEAQKAHDQVVKVWREQSKAGLTDLRREAMIALVAASAAYGDAARADREANTRALAGWVDRP